MAIPSIYINLDDDVSKIAIRLRRQSAQQVVLVCPRRCLLFSDSINLRLLKKQADLLGKEVFVLTMDERGQAYAKEAGFGLKFLPRVSAGRTMSDVRPRPAAHLHEAEAEPNIQEAPAAQAEPNPVEATFVQEPAKHAAGPKFYSSPKIVQPVAEAEVEQTDVQSEPGAEVADQPELIAEQPKPAGLPADEEPVTVQTTESFFPTEIQGHYSGGQKGSRLSKMILGVLTLSIAVVLLLYFVVLPKATVVVFPKTEAVTRDMQISLSTAAQSLDVDKLVLPATKVEQTVNVSDKFQSQGQNQVGNKASGTIKIYNFTGVPITLRAATTVLTVGNNTYSLANDVVGLPPTRYLNAATKEVNPKSLGASVQVQASQGGDAYNLPAGTRMEISNQVFGSRPQLLYAKTDTEINGGTTRYLSFISADDVSNAQIQLQKDALVQVRQQLQQTGEVLPDGAYSITVSQFITDNPAGTQTPSFQGSLTAQLTGLAFKQDDLDNLVNQRISETLASNKTLQQPTPDETTYSVQNLDLNNQVADLQAHFQGVAVYNVDLTGEAAQLRGKSLGQVNNLLATNPSVQKVEITLAPVWQKNLPWLTSKISLQLATAQQN